jgi:hypothetical protein
VIVRKLSRNPTVIVAAPSYLPRAGVPDRGGPACRSSQIRANPWRCTALEIRSSDMRDTNLAERRIF